jgi:hypothetical protein
MRQWEYLHLETTEGRIYIAADERRDDWKELSLHQVLNMLGAEGWELVSVAYEQAIMLPAHLVFKRELE